MADINVFMTGGRRAGKTSILAAMDVCAENEFTNSSNFRLICDEGIASISQKISELSCYFSDTKYTKLKRFNPDMSPSRTKDTYAYRAIINNRNADLSLRMTDVPGEWFKQVEFKEDIEKEMAKSQVIIIAVDTPHLMERTGDLLEEKEGYCIKHKEFNCVDEITNYFKKAFQGSGDSVAQERLIIFTPLKCEKYYYRGEMADVVEALKKGYADLLKHLAAPGIREICTVAVAPILTLGGAEFFKFDDSFMGSYNYVEDKALRRYSPKYCDQPLYLTLSYFLSILLKKANGKSWFGRMLDEYISGKAKRRDIADCERLVRSKIIRDKSLGFEIIQDPSDILG